jgi:hypothetical protein
MVSPHSDQVVPHLSEKDARLLARKIVERLRALGVFATRFGVDLDHDGFWFTADVNGKTVSARTGQGNFTYEQIARDLQLASIDPGWDRLTLKKGN